MAGRILGVCLAAALAGTVGCTSVQKGTAAGGAVGSGIGAVTGHAASGLGSGPGAIIGFGLGAAGGAIAADEYYGPEETGELAMAQANNEALAKQVEERDAALAEAQADAARERAQQKAILQAYEKLRAERMPAQAVTSASSGQVAAAPAESFSFTIPSAALFRSGRATLTSSGQSALKAAARDIRSRCTDPQIEVRGHTDSTPIRYSSYKSNWALSVARAQAVVNYLVEAEGFQSSQFTMVGCGDTQPIASNSTAAGRQKNRRAELIVQPGQTQVADVR
jgi:chemotaxis protein MotB